MSCTFWLRRKKIAAKKREQERLTAEAEKQVQPTEEKPKKKPAKKAVTEQ